MEQDTFPHYAEPGYSDTATGKADATKKGPAIADIAADHPAETAVHHLGEADIQTA